MGSSSAAFCRIKAHRGERVTDCSAFGLGAAGRGGSTATEVGGPADAAGGLLVAGTLAKGARTALAGAEASAGATTFGAGGATLMAGAGAASDADADADAGAGTGTGVSLLAGVATEVTADAAGADATPAGGGTGTGTAAWSETGAVVTCRSPASRK